MNGIAESKIYSLEDLSLVAEELRRRGKRIVFTNGCFDLIHTGHIRYLRQAREEGDCLVVAVNSDSSVVGLKGDSRPIMPLEDRMETLAAFYFVDYVVGFDEPDPYRVIKFLRPDVLIKGGDWPKERIIGRDIVEADGGKVFSIPLTPGKSTTGIIERILSLNK